jgi:hypothetical protein
MISRDRQEIRQAAVAIGYLGEDESEERANALANLIILLGEPLRHPGVYDFESSRLAARARNAGFDLVVRHGFMRPPPPETIFLHRKLAGTFFLCARIGAQVDTRTLVAPYLEDESEGAGA